MATEEIKSIFASMSDNIELVCKELDSNNARINATDSYDKETYWKRLLETSQKVSHDATKITLAFSKPPFPKPDSCRALCTSMEMSILALVSLFYGLPKQQGLTLHKEVKSAVQDILKSILGLSRDIQGSGSNGDKFQFLMTGSAWECCERIGSVSRDNLSAVLKVISTNRELVDDAFNELQTAIQEAVESKDKDEDSAQEEEEEEEEEEKWRSDEVDVAVAARGLVKVSQCCFKKVFELVKATNENLTIDLDPICAASDSVSSVIDVFVSYLYPPMNKRLMMETVVVVAEQLKSFLTAIKESSCHSKECEKWIECLENAIDHNVAQVENVTGKSRLG